MRAPLLARVAVLMCAIASATSGVGCHGAGASYDGRVYREGARIAFALGPVPEGWRRVESEAALAFRDEGAHATVLVNARCVGSEARTPLPALTNQLVMGSTDREVVSQEASPFDGREALVTHLRAKWDGVPMDHEIVVLSKDGCVYDFVWSGPPASYDAHVPRFRAFTRTFRTLPGSGAVS